MSADTHLSDTAGEISPPPSLTAQVGRLARSGLLERTGIPEDALRSAVAAVDAPADAIIALRPETIPVAELMPLVRHRGRPGFVVVDMDDADRFAPIDAAPLPESRAYLLTGVERGDQWANRSPDEALPAILAAGRTPLTLPEGIYWLLQQPEMLQRNACFMTIGSRLRRPGGALDARTPALWISNGTGRDGADHRHAPKAGWCWAGNRHTWLGFASATGRIGLAIPPANRHV